MTYHNVFGMKSPRIVFMGTPEFAVATLGSLLINGYNIQAVVTAPDKPAGRGRRLTGSAVKKFAEAESLPVMQPANLKDPAFIKALKELKPDVFIVVAFRMLPESVWIIPSVGTINLHASLLPQYRGAAPINHAVINGETVTGVTTFLINNKIDTGNILLRKEIPIHHFENAGDVHDKLMRIGAELVIRTLEDLGSGDIEPLSQEELIKPGETLKTAPKITPDFCIIDWKRKASEINNLIRGLAPYPGAKAFFGHQNDSIAFKIFESYPEITNHDYNPGTYISNGKSILKAACSDGFVNICNLQPEGRKRMSAEDFLRGFRIENYAEIV